MRTQMELDMIITTMPDNIIDRIYVDMFTIDVKVVDTIDALSPISRIDLFA